MKVEFLSIAGNTIIPTPPFLWKEMGRRWKWREGRKGEEE